MLVDCPGRLADHIVSGHANLGAVEIADVRDLAREAGITATITKLRPGHPLLTELAPGERTYVAPHVKPAPG